MRNVIFDLGGVVFDWNPDVILETYYPDPNDRAAVKSALFLHADWSELDRGTLSELEVLRRLAQRTRRPAAELDGLFAAVLESLKPKADTVALLERLVSRQVPLYCLSNMAVGTYGHLRERHSFWPAFRGIVISAQIKMMKPEPEIYRYLLTRYELSAERTVFVDDMPANVAAAAALGLHAVRFEHARQCEIELERLLE
jgi:putative hydrolase of the HAD superfamily